MTLGPRLYQVQSQAQVMAPQLQQVIKLLQMNNLELNKYIDYELEQNPLLQRDENDKYIGGPESGDNEAQNTLSGKDGSTNDETSEHALEIPDCTEWITSETLHEGNSATLDTNYENVRESKFSPDSSLLSDGYINQYSTLIKSINLEEPDIDNIAARDVTLREHLLGQVNVDFTDPVDRKIATCLIDMLDGAGYFRSNPAHVAVTLGCNLERVELTLERVKRFDPPGIFASDLAECLALQLHDKNRLNPAMETLLENLELLAERDFIALRRACGVDMEVIAKMICDIKALNPKPASAFDFIVAQSVTPDVLVHRHNSHGWVVELNSDTLPRLLVNSRYLDMGREKFYRKDEQQYLVECLQSANWLVKSLQQRAETILKVATALVHMQEDYFTKGVQHLKPMTLRDVAQEVGVHESTVSRVTNGKYIGIWEGVYEMKKFFSVGVGRTKGSDLHSAESVRHKIKNLVDIETADNVLSDDRIVELLNADGIDIARRTVAKYRVTMHIPSSFQRRRERSLQAP